MNADAVEHEGVIFEILTGLDVVLILICPIKLDFLALVRDSVDAFLVATFGNKIAVFIVTIEERIQRGIYVRFKCGKVGTFRKGREGFFNHFGQSMRKELFNLRLAEIQHAINTKIKVGFIKIENFLQQFYKSV